MMGHVMTTTAGQRRPPAAPLKAHAVTPMTLDELLSDQLTRTVMKADRVDPRELETTLRRVARNLAKQRGTGW
jgi:hypothetical protein